MSINNLLSNLFSKSNAPNEVTINVNIRFIQPNINTKVMARENKFGYDEVVDTLGDLIDACGPDGLRSAFKKGQKFQLIKFLTEAAEVYPTIEEAFNDFSTFWAQTKDLVADESLNVAGALKARFVNPDQIQSKMIEVVENGALTHSFFEKDVINNLKGVIDKGEVLFQKWANI